MLSLLVFHVRHKEVVRRRPEDFHHQQLFYFSTLGCIVEAAASVMTCSIRMERLPSSALASAPTLRSLYAGEVQDDDVTPVSITLLLNTCHRHMKTCEAKSTQVEEDWRCFYLFTGQWSQSRYFRVSDKLVPSCVTGPSHISNPHCACDSKFNFKARELRACSCAMLS
jgi:hypothetical protein